MVMMVMLRSLVMPMLLAMNMLLASTVDVDVVEEAEKTKRFEKMRKNFHRGQDSKNSVGKRTRQDPPVRVKRQAVALLHQKCDVPLDQWFSTRRAQNLPVSTRMLNDEAQQLAQPSGHILPRRWLEIDIALAALYKTAPHRLYVAHMEGNASPLLLRPGTYL